MRGNRNEYECVDFVAAGAASDADDGDDYDVNDDDDDKTTGMIWY